MIVILAEEQPKRKIRVESTNEDHSSSDDEKRCQRQKKQKKKRCKRCNTSGNTSAIEVKNRKFIREKCHGVDDHLPLYNEETTDEQTVDGYYVSPSLTYATLAINHHMNRLWLHQELMNEQLFAKKKLVENSDSPSDITVSSNSDSSLNISINSSSAEEDKNGILTFYLSSDEENFNENLKHYDKIKNKDEQTYLSLNSKTTPQAKVARINSDVVVLSSSSSSSSEPENENKVKQPIGISESPKFIQNNFDSIYVDLTQE
uniref:Uncharacterized protein n=1 Tax=Glossina brevipalpis TaxID=37001 RepID=A0A1A9X0C9_9MUSC